MSTNALKYIVTIVTGTLFGAGLAFSGMVNPVKAQGFFDVFGQWDPSLALTFVAALIIAWLAYQIQPKMAEPVIGEEKFAIPTNRTIDNKLMIGAAIFGIGWGLFGFCPGPDVASMMYGQFESFIFFFGLILGVMATWLLPK